MASVAPSRAEVLDVLRSIDDPELGIDIVSLGLVYRLDIDPDGRIAITMTLTTPGCPLHAVIGHAIERALGALGATQVLVTLTFSPPWDPGMMTDDARRRLGMP